MPMDDEVFYMNQQHEENPYENENLASSPMYARVDRAKKVSCKSNDDMEEDNEIVTKFDEFFGGVQLESDHHGLKVSHC